MCENIKNLQNIVDDIKTKITDNEYKNISDNIQKIFNEKSNDIYKVYLYYPHITTNVCSNNECDDLSTYNNLQIKEITFLTTINTEVDNHPLFSRILNELKNNKLVICGQYIKHIFEYVPLEFKISADYIFTNSNSEENQNVVFNVDSMIDNVLVKMNKLNEN